MDLPQLDRQIQILVLAAHDMDQVIAACEVLERDEHPGVLGEALATAIVVCYARPFSASNTVGRLGKQWTPKSGTPERELHDWLLDERDKRYAHTDQEAMRFVVHRNDSLGGFDALAEISLPFPPSGSQ
jgi:hypothetical protein